MDKTGSGVQPCMLALHRFALALDMTSQLIANLLEIIPVIHHPFSLPHKENKISCSKHLQHSLQTHVSAQSLTVILLLLIALMGEGNSSWKHPQIGAL